MCLDSVFVMFFLSDLWSWPMLFWVAMFFLNTLSTSLYIFIKNGSSWWMDGWMDVTYQWYDINSRPLMSAVNVATSTLLRLLPILTATFVPSSNYGFVYISSTLPDFHTMMSFIRAKHATTFSHISIHIHWEKRGTRSELSNTSRTRRQHKRVCASYYRHQGVLDSGWRVQT